MIGAMTISHHKGRLFTFNRDDMYRLWRKTQQKKRLYILVVTQTGWEILYRSTNNEAFVLIAAFHAKEIFHKNKRKAETLPYGGSFIV